MLDLPFSVKSIAKGEEAKESRTLVFDEDFKLRPLIPGSSIGEDEGKRLFQQVFRGDYIITTIRGKECNYPRIRVTRHRDALISGLYAAEVLNRIPAILARYLMDYSI